MNRISAARIWAFLVLLALAACLLAMRAHTFDEPLERDLTSYAVVGNQLLNGLSLYSDIWVKKPPGVYATYAAANYIFGMGQMAVYFLGALTAVLTLFGIYFAVRTAQMSRAAALWAAAFWVAIASDLSLLANQPNIEVFVNVFVVWGFALVLRSNTKRSKNIFAASFFFGVAALYDPLVLAIFVLILGAHFFISGSRRRFLSSVVGVIVSLLAFCLPWVLTVGYFYKNKNYSSFLGFANDYLRTVNLDIASIVSSGLTLHQIFPPVLYFCFPLLMIIVFGAALSWLSGFRRWFYLIALMAGTALEITLRRELYPHHYQYWLPVFVIGIGYGLGAALEFCTPVRFGKLYRLPYLVAIGVFGFIVHREIGYFQVSAEDWSHMKYAEIFVETDKLGNWIRKKLYFNETFFNWGDESGLYYSSGLNPPTGMLKRETITNGPQAPQYSMRVLEQLKDHRPVLLVVLKSESDEFKASRHPVAQWLNQNYTKLASQSESGPFLLYGLNESDFAKR
jgi:4-amino-4-deoxy-L-arabinose transferase-like glycosyltransferase